MQQSFDPLERFGFLLRQAFVEVLHGLGNVVE